MAESIHSFFDRLKDKKQRFSPTDLEKFHHSRINSAQSHPLSRFVTGNISADQGSKPSRIHIRHFREIKHNGSGVFPPDRMLKRQQILRSQRPMQTQNSLPG